MCVCLCLIIHKRPAYCSDLFCGICSTPGPCIYNALFHLCFPGEKVRGLTIQKACFPSPLWSSLILSHFGLTLNSSPETGGPQAASSSCFPCHSQVAEEVAVTDTAAPAVGLGCLPVTGAGGSVPPGTGWGSKALRAVPRCP